MPTMVGGTVLWLRQDERLQGDPALTVRVPPPRGGPGFASTALAGTGGLLGGAGGLVCCRHISHSLVIQCVGNFETCVELPAEHRTGNTVC